MSGNKKLRLKSNQPKEGTFVQLVIEKSTQVGSAPVRTPIAEYRALADHTGLEVRVIQGKHQSFAEAVVVNVKVKVKGKSESVFYRCRILKETKTAIPLRSGFTEEGKILDQKINTVKIEYPWPDKLASQLANRQANTFQKDTSTNNFGFQPLPGVKLNAPDSLRANWFVPPELGWKISNIRKDTNTSLTLTPRFSGKQGDILSSIKRVAEAIVKKERAAQANLKRNREAARPHQTAIQQAQNNNRKPKRRNTAELRRLNQLEGALDKALNSATNELEAIAPTINALRDQYNAMPEIVVLDAWGIPLKRLKLEFFVGKKGKKIDRGFVEQLAERKPKKK
jgi:hypothetical protein